MVAVDKYYMNHLHIAHIGTRSLAGWFDGGDATTRARRGGPSIRQSWAKFAGFAPRAHAQAGLAFRRKKEEKEPQAPQEGRPGR